MDEGKIHQKRVGSSDSECLDVGWGHAGKGSNQPQEHLVFHVRAVVAPSTHGVPEDGEVRPDAPAVEHQRPGEASH